MRVIFTGASRVLVWIDDEDEHTPLAFETLNLLFPALAR